MKTIKYFAALAFPVMLASCVNEEIAVETPLKMQEVAGAELIGTDISLNATNGSAGSRFVGGESGFGKLDKLGLGWAVVNNGPSQSQTVNGEFYNNKLYANHLFEYVEGETNTFVTKSNIYKGYHFAYYPYTFMEEVGAKTIEISPKQEVGYVDNEESTAYNKRLAQQFQISALQFLDRNSLDDNYQLKREFPMKSPLSQLVVKTTAKGSFATNTNLKNYKIKSVTFNLGKDVFAHSAELDVTKLFKLGTNQRPDMTIPQANEQGLLNSFAEVMKPKYATTATVEGETIVTWHNGRASNTKTEVSVDNYVVSASNPRLMTFVLPMNEATSFTEDEKKAVSVEIEAGGGKFVINYTPNAEEKSPEDTNNKALAQLVAAYSEGGAFVGKYNQQEILNIVLTEADFVADFTGVTNDNWAEKVQLANDLNRGVETFTLAKGANVIFEGKNLDAEGKMLAPKNGVIVKTVDDSFANGKLTIGAVNSTTEWNELINIKDYSVALYVVEGATLDVNSELIPTRIFNYGTIAAGPMAEVGRTSSGEGYLLNYGRVDVEYGAYVNVHSSAKGIIAYTLNASDVENPSRVMELIATSSNKHGHANVNTLVINKPIDIDLYKNVDGTTGSTEEGRYNDKVTSSSGATGDYWIQDLAAVSLEINDGIVKASYAPVTVANVTINGGAIKNIAVAGNLTVKGGNVVANVANIAEALTIEAGQGEITAATIGSVDIKSGNFTVNAQTIEGDVTATGENYFNVETIKGNVVLTNNSTTVTHIEGATIEGDVTLNGSWDLRGVTFKGNLTVNGAVKSKDLTIDNTLIVNEGAKFGISGEDATISHIKNYGELTTSVNVYAKTVRIYDRSDANVATGMTIWYTEPTEGQYGYTQEGTTHGRILYFGAQWASTLEELQNAIDAAVEGENVILFGGDIEGTLTVTQKKDVKITIDGRNHQLAGSIIVDGKSARFETAALNISNIDFRGTTSETVFINLGVSGNNATRYTNHVTVDGCTFEGEECVAIKSYTGGDKNLKINNCVVAKNMHSFVQVANVEEGLEIANCQVYSKNGVNLNATLSLLMDKCTFDVRGYAVRLGQGPNVAGEGKAFEIKNSALKSACEESDDAVIVFRGDAKKATLTLENTSVTGTKVYLGNEVANIVVK